MPPHLLNAEDMAMLPTVSVLPDATLLEALRAFASRQVEMLPVDCEAGHQWRLVGILLRSDVMRRYRMEPLRKHL